MKEENDIKINESKETECSSNTKVDRSDGQYIISKEAKKNILVAVILFFVQLAFSGYSVISVKFVKNINLNIFVLVWFRSMIAAICAVILAWIVDRRFIFPHSNYVRSILFFSIFGLVSTSLNPIMYLFVVQYTSASYVTILGQLIPLFNTIFSWIFRIEQFPNTRSVKSIIQIIGIIIGVGFAVAITGVGFKYPVGKVTSHDWLYGTVIGILNNVLFSLYHVFQSKLFYRNATSELNAHPFTINAYCNVFGATIYCICLLPYLVLNSRLFHDIPPIAALPILYSSIINSTIGYGLITFCNRRSSPTTIGAAWSLQVAIGILLLNIVAKETMLISQYFCCVGVVVGVWLVIFSPTLGAIIDRRISKVNSSTNLAKISSLA